jgi:hypothetical protein
VGRQGLFAGDEDVGMEINDGAGGAGGREDQPKNRQAGDE